MPTKHSFHEVGRFHEGVTKHESEYKIQMQYVYKLSPHTLSPKIDGKSATV
jgi:hypothetical protein